MELAPLVFSSSWASGINGYAVVALLGLLGRFAQMAGIPPVLMRTDVLIGASVLALADLVIDKIALLDSSWDAVHTVIRPALGATVAALLADTADVSTGQQLLAAVLGGAIALASHGVKSGVRLAVNTSPEPVSNVLVSSAEDAALLGVVGLSALWPWAAAGVAGVLLITGLTLVYLVARFVRARAARRAARREARAARLNGQASR